MFTGVSRNIPPPSSVSKDIVYLFRLTYNNRSWMFPPKRRWVSYQSTLPHTPEDSTVLYIPLFHCLDSELCFLPGPKTWRRRAASREGKEVVVVVTTSMETGGRLWRRKSVGRRQYTRWNRRRGTNRQSVGPADILTEPRILEPGFVLMVTCRMTSFPTTTRLLSSMWGPMILYTQKHICLCM